MDWEALMLFVFTRLLGSLAVGAAALGIFWIADHLGIPRIESAIAIYLMIWFFIHELD